MSTATIGSLAPRAPNEHVPYLRKTTAVNSVMLRVLIALLPGIGAYVCSFGAAMLVQLALPRPPR